MQNKATVEVSDCSKRVSTYLNEQQQQKAATAKRETDLKAREAQRETDRQTREAAYRSAQNQKASRASQRHEEAPRALPSRDNAPNEFVPTIEAPDQTRPLVQPNAATSIPQGTPARSGLSDEQVKTLQSTGLGVVATYLSNLRVSSIRRAILAAGSQGYGNPVLEYAQPFLDPDNYQNIKATIDAQFRQAQSGSWNKNESRMLDELERASVNGR